MKQRSPLAIRHCRVAFSLVLLAKNDTFIHFSSNEYNDDNTLKETTFGNGGKVMNTYDEFKRLKGVRYDSDTEDRYVYDYAANGQIAKVTDKNLNRVTVSEFDVANRPCQITTLENGSHLYNARLTYDEFSQPKSFQERVSGSFDFYRTDFAYDIEGKPTQLGYGLSDQERDDTKVVNAYDNLGRLASRTVKVDGTSYATSYTYLPGPEENTTTSLIASISQGSGENAENFVYTYDDNGNITSVSRNGVVTTYQYDALGQLIRTDDPFDPISGSSSGSTWTFAYDRGGNILNKKYYAFTTSDLPATPLRTYNYTYDSDWKDKLTSYYGFSYTYDAIGNPLTDGTWNYTWEKGRQLRQMRNGSMRILFAYDASGMRIKKTVNETDITNYTYHGKNLVHLKKTGGTDMHFYYDAQNRPAIVNYNGSNYAYIYNLQGDVMALLDNTGTKVVEYAYNAWGKLLNTSGSMAATLGVLNPFRYRGYIYDEETGYYYLRSRYYYPNRGRFINADALILKNEKFFCNQYVYSINNPINFFDPSGYCIGCALADVNVNDKDEYFEMVIKQRLHEYIFDCKAYSYISDTVIQPKFKEGDLIQSGQIACAHLMKGLTESGAITVQTRYEEFKGNKGLLFNKNNELQVTLQQGMEVYKMDKKGKLSHVGMLILWDLGAGEEWCVIQSASMPITKCRALFKNDTGPNITSFYSIKPDKNGNPFSDWDYYTDRVY